jgi:hypothetical protein
MVSSLDATLKYRMKKPAAKPHQDIVERIYRAIKQNAAVPAERSGAPRLFRHPSEEDARFLLDMSCLLQSEYGMGSKDDCVGRIVEIARTSATPLEAIQQLVYVDSAFMPILQDTLANPETTKYIFPHELEHPKPLIDILRIYNANWDAYGPVSESNVNFTPHAAKDVRSIYSQGVCIYKGEAIGKHWTSKDTHTIDSVMEPLGRKDERPKIFYFGGSTALDETELQIQRNIRRIRTVIDTAQISPDMYDVYNVTYNNHAVMYHMQDTLEHAVNPATHTSKEAVAFVEQYLRPLYATGKGKKAEAGYSEAELKHRFSLVTLVGFSYGTVFIREICNAMQQDMEKLGYDKRTIQNTLPHIASFNLASTGYIAHDIPHHFAQVHINTKPDELSMARSNLKSLVAKDRSRCVRRFSMPTKTGLSLLALEAENATQTMAFYAPSENGSSDAFAVNDAGGKERRFSRGPEYTQQNTEYHHIGSFLATNSIRHCDGLLSVCATPSAHFIADSLRAQVGASVKASTSPTGKRDAEAIMKEVADRTLSPDALRAIAAERDKYLKQINRNQKTTDGARSRLAPMR